MVQSVRGPVGCRFVLVSGLVCACVVVSAGRTALDKVRGRPHGCAPGLGFENAARAVRAVQGYVPTPGYLSP